jgi:hypothetical protein
MIENFTQTLHCSSHAHCHICRADTLEGQRWRLTVTGQTTICCPIGTPLGQPPARLAQLPDALPLSDLQSLATTIRAIGTPEAIAVADAQLDRAGRATCTPCGQRAAEATLRAWLQHHAPHLLPTQSPQPDALTPRKDRVSP